jgi:hypothetical protein
LIGGHRCGHQRLHLYPIIRTAVEEFAANVNDERATLFPVGRFISEGVKPQKERTIVAKTELAVVYFWKKPLLRSKFANERSSF